MNKGLSIVGSSRSNGEREKYDFYPTPSYAVDELLKREIFKGNIWECACGDGAISSVLELYGYNVYSTDLVYRNYGKGNINFLDNGLFNSFEKQDNIITNPPYKYALEFILQAKKLSNKKIAMFLKTVFLESQKRKKMFQDKEFPLKTVYQFSKRVNPYKNGKVMKNSGMIAYAWYVWDKEYCGKPTIEWI
jgi:hypothetical protein